MKNLIIGILIVTNVLTIVFANFFVDALNGVFNEEQDGLVNELDKFYFGFCLEAKESGYGTLESYTRLCGE